MKKLLLLLSVSMLMSSTFVMAQGEFETVYHYEENESLDLGVVPPTVIKVTNNSSTGHGVWVTVYNTILQISDVACLTPGKVVEFMGYMPGFKYQVRVEVKENVNDCNGRTIKDMANLYPMGIVGIDVNVLNDGTGYKMETK
jgi:hypothetical protein